MGIYNMRKALESVLWVKNTVQRIDKIVMLPYNDSEKQKIIRRKKVMGALAAVGVVSDGLGIAEKTIQFFRYIKPKIFYKHNYYFEEVNKKVFIKKNGDGVIICACDLYVINPNKVENFVRGIDISDAKKATEFPPFKVLHHDKIKFFDEYGFWCDSQDGIVTSVKECYDDPTLQMKIAGNNSKQLGIKFILDKNKLKPKHKYRIVYGYSIPGLYPVKNGKHDRNEFSKKKYGMYTSCMSVKHMSKNLRFAIYLERGFKIKSAPSGHAIKISDNKDIKDNVCEVRNNLLYTKYLYRVKRPEKYRSVYIEWDLE